VLEDVADVMEEATDAALPDDASDDVAIADVSARDDGAPDGAADDADPALDPTLQGGCTCRAATPPRSACAGLWIALAAVALGRRRGRRR
jgi:hypothetical protein